MKIALDETRILVLGAQVLIGFQFRSVFQNLYDQLPVGLHRLDGVALLLLIVALALLIFPGPYHQVVEEGRDTIPLALGLAADLGVVGNKMLESSLATATAAVLAVLFGLWHVLPLVARRRRHPAVPAERSPLSSRPRAT